MAAVIVVLSTLVRVVAAQVQLVQMQPATLVMRVALVSLILFRPDRLRLTVAAVAAAVMEEALLVVLAVPVVVVLVDQVARQEPQESQTLAAAAVAAAIPILAARNTQAALAAQDW
jgi:hypothetical protein